jgi:site-specific DNA-cytosine methylase
MCAPGFPRMSAAPPLAIDLFCGLGGWTEGLLAEGWDVIGFDIERHEYGDAKYPAQLVLQDVLTLHGSQFKDADLIVASPPCQAYSYRAMPWKRAKALPPPDNSLFEACFRIQREACEAAGRHIPLVVENVKGAQKWVGRSRWNYGSFHLWGDVPALMPTRPAARTRAARGSASRTTTCRTAAATSSRTRRT